MYFSILVTGANRGIGLGLIKEFLNLEHPPTFVFAIVRDSSSAQELVALAEDNSSLRIIECDVSKFEQHPKLVEAVQKVVGTGGLSMLINNAGICPKTTTFEDLDMSELDECLHVNVKTPMRLTQALLPLLKSGAGNSYSWIVNISSALASMSANCTAGYYPYRVSKAALNAFTKNLSIELKHDQVLALVLHPGWVRTDMGGSSGDLSVPESCHGLMTILAHLKPSQNGKFYQYNGQEIAW